MSFLTRIANGVLRLRFPRAGRHCVVLVFVLAAFAQAADAAPPYVRVLLPLYLSQPVKGAYESLWQSRFAIHSNASTREYHVKTICAPYEGCAGDDAIDELLAPGTTMSSLPVRYRQPLNPVAGTVVWLSTIGAPVGDGEDLAFQLRVADLSRSATSAGTEVPVVREKDFRLSITQLLNVPVDPRFRLALRVFEMNLAEANFNVRVYDQATNALLSQRTITTSTNGVEPLRFTPGFAEISDLRDANIDRMTLLRVEIEPLTRSAAFWSYVSVTNNDSQQITLVTPQ